HPPQARQDAPLPEIIKREALALGFQTVGISRVAGSDSTVIGDLHHRLTEWLERSYHGAMAWMGRDPDRRADPRKVLAGCRSVISVGMNYYTEHRADEGPGHGRIARYAWGADYHAVLKDRLSRLESKIRISAPEAQTRCYVDTGPVMEKAWAQQAGLGWIGKHSNLVSPHFGSWLLLGEILTTLDLEPDQPAADLCGSCTLCIRACPTGAITDPYVVDARRCVSYLTIELPRTGEPIPDELSHRIGNRIFGCDDCLDVCPYNINATPTAEEAFQPSALTLAPRLSEMADMSESAFSDTFRRSPIRRAKYTGLLANVLAALRHVTPHVLKQSV
ncbi:MAG: tRNA epoxyqueuosine(34) reductase QueG, partial [Nitrospiraceae bacterium]